VVNGSAFIYIYIFKYNLILEGSGICLKRDICVPKCQIFKTHSENRKKNKNKKSASINEKHYSLPWLGLDSNFQGNYNKSFQNKVSI